MVDVILGDTRNPRRHRVTNDKDNVKDIAEQVLTLYGFIGRDEIEVPIEDSEGAQLFREYIEKSLSAEANLLQESASYRYS